jgi:hypothetical protein
LLSVELNTWESLDLNSSYPVSICMGANIDILG